MKRVPLRIILFILLLFSLFAVIILSKDYALNHFNGTIHTEDNWTLEIKKLNYRETTNLPITFKYQGKYKYTLTKKLSYEPKSFESPYAFFSINHMYFNVYLDNKEVFSYTSKDTPHYSKSPGNSYAMIPLTKDCTGKEFKIEFFPTLEDGLVYTFHNILFCDYPTYMHNTFKDNYPHDIMVTCILYTGLMLVICSKVILDNNNSKNAWHIGMFAVLFALYNLTESLFNLYMISNPYLTYLISFFTFAAIPIPLLLYFKDKVLPTFHKFYNVIIAFHYINIAIQAILHFLKIKDIRQLLMFTQILLFFTFVTIFISICKTPSSTYTNKKHLIISITPIILGLILDGVLHFFFICKVSRSNTFYLQFGVLFFLIMQVIEVLKSILFTYRENVKMDLYKTMAYKDGLTGLYNRSCYNNEISKIKSDKKLFKNLVCVCVDINNLKQINDNNGHQTGDKVICETALFLKNQFGELGKVFRVGGDEFYIFIYNMTEKQFKQKLNNVYEQLKKYNKTNILKLCFSLGYEFLNTSKSIENCISKADKNMYKQKLKTKK